MNLKEAAQAIKGDYSKTILTHYGYSDTRRAYTSIEPSSHKNGDTDPSMHLHNKGVRYCLKDFAGDCKYYSAIDVIMILDNLDFVSAVRKGAELCGIKIDETKTDIPPDLRFIIAGLYRKAEREHFIVRDILATHHYHYKDITGKKLYDKYRVDYITSTGKKSKHIVLGIESNGFVRTKFNKNEYQRYIALYGDFREYEPEEIVFIPEGEKCVDACHDNGLQNVITCGSSGDWASKGQGLSQYFKNVNVVIMQDNDYAGEKLTKDIISSLYGVAKSIKIIIPDTTYEGADIADYFEKGGTIQQLEEMIANAPYYDGNKGKKETTTKIEADKSDQNGTGALVETLVKLKAAEKFATNDKGSAELYATVFRSANRYNPTQKDWMHYNGIKWTNDVEGMKAKRNAKRLADALMSYAIGVDLDEQQRQNYIKYVYRLTSYHDRNIMVNDAKDLNYFGNEELDKDDALLNCQNCVVDLSGNEPKILHHNSDLLLSKVCNANYNPAAQCPLWIKTINEIMQNDIAKINYLQKVFGLTLTGYTYEELMHFLYGSTTRNGKSTVTELALWVLGDYGATISPETLALRQNKDSRTASPDIAKLAGARLVVASEPPKKMLFDTALTKTLTGGDSITARFLHCNEFTFKPKFKLLINTNYLPTITDDTIFKSGRIRVINFGRHFEPHEQNKHLKEQLRAEADGILNWFIKGLQLYRQEGLEPPAAVTQATAEYENDSDKIGRFIGECLIKTNENISAKIVYETYTTWCSDNGYGCENKGNFFTELKVKGIFAASGTVKGKTVRNIVRGYTLATEDFTSVDDENLPFE